MLVESPVSLVHSQDGVFRSNLMRRRFLKSLFSALLGVLWVVFVTCTGFIFWDQTRYSSSFDSQMLETTALMCYVAALVFVAAYYIRTPTPCYHWLWLGILITTVMFSFSAWFVEDRLYMNANDPEKRLGPVIVIGGSGIGVFFGVLASSALMSIRFFDRQPPGGRKKAVLTIASLPVLVLALVVGMSLRGGSPSNPPYPGRIVHIGCHTDLSNAQTIALTRLSKELKAHPSVRYFDICWVDSWFFGFEDGHQWDGAYDRYGKELEEDNMESGPTERWKPVPEALLDSLASVGFDEKMLHQAGSHSDLP